MPTKCFTKVNNTGEKYVACVDVKTFKKKGIKDSTKSIKPTAKSIKTIRSTKKKLVIKRSITGLIAILDIIMQKHKANIDNTSNATFKARSYNKMLNILLKYPETHITKVDQITDFFKENGVAKPIKIGIIVSEYLETGKNKEALEAKKRPELKSIMNLTKIYAIGPANAKKLYTSYNIITITDLKNQLKKTPDILNNKQKLGLKYHTDLQKRIPRSEIDSYKIVLESFCEELSTDIDMSINGSYRRGLKESGDIDVLITFKNPDDDTSALRNKLIKNLHKAGIIKEILANGKKKFMGISKLESEGFTIARHMDIIDTSKDQYPYAQLYFTGSGGFNSMMRANALKQGYSLNEYTLSHKMTKKPIDSQLILSKIGRANIVKEQDIFEFLDMEYVKPENRNKITISKVLPSQGHE